jgi:hypothetical protein
VQRPVPASYQRELREVVTAGLARGASHLSVLGVTVAPHRHPRSRRAPAHSPRETQELREFVTIVFLWPGTRWNGASRSTSRSRQPTRNADARAG